MNPSKISCHTEYDVMESVVLCKPEFMRIHHVINETQRRYHKENINVETAIAQHTAFMNVLKENGIEVHHLPPKKEFPEQVFTRDIGFTIGDTIFISAMSMPVRQGEEQILKDWLKNYDLPFIDLTEDQTEGGDVIIHQKTVYIGISERTTEHAIEHIQAGIPDYTIIPIPIKQEILHLDCIFNILSPTEALIHKEGMEDAEYELLKSHFDLIEVSEEEQFAMGANVLSIGHKKVISLPQNKGVNGELKKRGYDVIEVDFSEIIKSGGSFRCCTMPLSRRTEA